MNWRNLTHQTPWHVIDCLNGDYKTLELEPITKNDDFKNQILLLHSQGHKPKAIRELTGCHWTYIHNTIKKNT